MKSCFYLFVIALALVSCKKNIKFNSNVFSFEGDVYAEALENQNFIKKGDAYPRIYEKQNKDTLVILELNKDLNHIHTKTWKIKVAEGNMSYIGAFLRNNYFSTTNSYSQYYNGLVSAFYIISNINNRIYICKLLKENDQDYLEIKYHVEHKE